MRKKVFLTSTAGAAGSALVPLMMGAGDMDARGGGRVSMRRLGRRHWGAGFAVLAFVAGAWALLPHSGRRSTLQWIESVCSTVERPMFASAPPREGEAAHRPASIVKPLSCEALPNVPGKAIITALVEYPPRAYSPAHRHPGSVMAVVIDGSVRSQLGGGSAIDYQAGQTWFEPPGTLHLFAENPDPVRSAKLLATYVADENCGPLVLPPGPE